MADRSILDVARALKKYAPGGQGLNIGEHPELGGVGSGHSPTGYHYTGEAVDVRDWRPDVAPAYVGGKPIPWKQRTGELSWRAKQLGLFNEALGPGDKGHDTHVHLALKGKKFITDQQLEWLATGRYKNPEGKLTDVMPGATQQLQVAAAQPQVGTDSRAEDIIKAFMYGAQLQGKEPEKPKKTIQDTLKEQLVGGLISQALNPMGFLDSYRTNDPLLMGQSSATSDYLNGLFG